MDSIKNILKTYWQYDSFRPLQEEIIGSVLEKNDTLALLPTGGGKSLCFQVPALAMDGLCLVISPLIALMKDQVENLRKKNITAFAIVSGMDRIEITKTLKVASGSNCKFLYVSPERLETNIFREYLPSLPVNLIAVDEAHCISQWGYDFRPPYLRIAALRDELPDIPVLALTASATPEVQEDICNKLKFKKLNIFRQSFERPNLSYSVFHVDSKINKVIDILQKVEGSSIIYCKSRRRTKEIADLLNMNEIKSVFYHAGLSREERTERQEAWIKNETRCIVSTNAFGMGIDKSEVRLVIHADVPDCLENYYQEAGRAGRSGQRAYAVLLYQEKETEQLSILPEIHFPSPENIQIVYQALINYLQIPNGSGEGNYYDFNIADFIRKFNLDSQLAVYALKALEQEELITINEQVFIPSKIEFSTRKEMLYEFEKNNPALEPLIKSLLRTYEGIFDQPVAIHEKTISRLLNISLSQTEEDLKRLHFEGIIRYIPQADKPQIYFIENRVKTEDLRINHLNYGKRKQQYKLRIEELLNYIHNKTGCRSQLIGRYFGDISVKACGICDTCLRQKNSNLTKEEFNTIHHRILEIIEPAPMHTNDLLNSLTGIRKEKLWKVIEFLHAEQKIAVNEKGEIKLK